MTDSGVYTPETIARRIEMAKALLAEPKQPIRHWTEGLNELMKGWVGGNIYGGAEKAEREGSAAQMAAIASLLGGGGGGGPPAMPGQGAGPPSMPPPSGPSPEPQVPMSMDSPIDGPVPMPRPRPGGVIGSPDVGFPAAPAPRPVQQATEGIVSAVTPEGVDIAPGLNGPGAGAQAAGGLPNGSNPPPDGGINAKIAAMLRDPNPFVRKQGAALGQQAIVKMLGNEGTENIKNFEYAKKNGFPGSFLDFVQQEKSRAGGQYGLQPVSGTDKNGNRIIMQLSGTGKATQTQLPEGVTLSDKNLMRIDTGTEIQWLDPVSRQIVYSTPKDIVGKEAAEEVGKAKGTAQVDLPRVVGNADQALATIEKIRNHPAKDMSVGTLGVLPGIPGTQQKDFVSLVDQAKGKAFLEAFNSLRGGGAITEMEGKKATDALARLDRTQSKKGFDTALNDLEQVIKQGVERARQKAAMGAGGSVPAVAPSAAGIPPPPPGFSVQ